MHTTLTTLLDNLDRAGIARTDVIRWGSPVPAFGDLSASRVATLGLNPSRREFVDSLGNELQGPFRRFHTLSSLGLSSWGDVDARHLELMLESCRVYFMRNPYQIWFRKLDHVVLGTGTSYYNPASRACHLDLIPFATAQKWTDLSARQRSSLFSLAADTLGLLLRDSPVRLLILNGKSVVRQFQEVTGVRLHEEKIHAWSLPRQSRPLVAGYAYQGVADAVCGVDLGRDLVILGFNHNLQSSFGVTNELIQSIHHWVSRAAKGALQ